MAVKTNITINIVEPGSDVPVPDTGLFTHGVSGTETTIIVSAALVTVLVILSIVLTTYMYRKHKKQGRTTKLVHIIDQTKAVVKSKKRVTIGLSIIALLVSACTFTAFMLNTNKSNTSAIEGNDTEQQTGNTEQTENTNNLTINTESEELTIEVKDQPVFAVLPVQVTVEEATKAGYTLTAYTDNTDLVSTTNPNNKIPMVALPETAGELSPLTDNTYGLALGEEPTTKDAEVYMPLSIDSDIPTIIKSMPEYTPTAENDTTTIYYGFYITPDTPYGTYTGAVVNYEAEMNAATVVYNGNGLYFNDNEEQTTNTVKYVVGITENTEKYSNTPNLDKYTGEQISGEYIHFGTYLNSPIEIPGATKVHVSLKYGIYDGFYNQDNNEYWAYMTIWQGNKPNYTAANDYDKGIKQCGTMTTTDGRINGYDGYTNNGQMIPINVECDITGDAVTFGFWTQPGGGPSIGYGYYAIVTGYDENGNIIYLNGNTPKKGEYKEPAQDLPYKFLGWSEDKDATTATYESKNDIELNLPLTMGETTELYAIWQHATKIHFDGNGSTSGEMPDKLLAAGKGTSLCNDYTRTGYAFNNWNTEPDGSGTPYSYCSWYTASSESTELTLYAQWSPVTTIIYDGNGGEGSQQQQTIRAGETSSIYNGQSYFSRTGYAFSHWNTEPDGTGTTYNQGDSFTASDQSTIITLYAQWVGNVLDTGQTVNVKLKRLAGNSSAKYDTVDTNVTTIARASDLPANFTPTNNNTISINGSTTPVYAWYDTDTTTIYYYTESEKIIMNPNSSSMFYNFKNLSNATSIADWDTSKVTDMSAMFTSAGSNATTFSLDLSSWDTSNVTRMVWMFSYAGYNATTFSLDLSSWNTSNVTDMSYMFYLAGRNATTWSVTIPQKTGDINNTTSAFYGQNSSVYATPPNNKSFTLAAQANSNTTNTTESSNSVNNVEATIQGGSSRNYSVYTTEDVEDTENDDDTGLDTTSTPSRQEPLGEYQSSTTTSTKDTNIIIPILIVAAITLGISTLVFLIYKSLRQEDE